MRAYIKNKYMGQTNWKSLIDKEEFEKVLTIGANFDLQIILDYFSIEQGTLYKWVKAVYKTEHPHAYIKKLRARKLVGFALEERKLARGEIKGNPAMYMWLGKNYFGQSDPDKAIFRKEEPNVDVEERPDVFNEIAKRLKGGK